MIYYIYAFSWHFSPKRLTKEEHWQKAVRHSLSLQKWQINIIKVVHVTTYETQEPMMPGTHNVSIRFISLFLFQKHYWNIVSYCIINLMYTLFLPGIIDCLARSHMDYSTFMIHCGMITIKITFLFQAHSAGKYSKIVKYYCNFK